MDRLERLRQLVKAGDPDAPDELALQVRRRGGEGSLHELVVLMQDHGSRVAAEEILRRHLVDQTEWTPLSARALLLVNGPLYIGQDGSSSGFLREGLELDQDTWIALAQRAHSLRNAGYMGLFFPGGEALEVLVQLHSVPSVRLTPAPDLPPPHEKGGDGAVLAFVPEHIHHEAAIRGPNVYLNIRDSDGGYVGVWLDERYEGAERMYGGLSEGAYYIPPTATHPARLLPYMENFGWHDHAPFGLYAAYLIEVPQAHEFWDELARLGLDWDLNEFAYDHGYEDVADLQATVERSPRERATVLLQIFGNRWEYNVGWDEVEEYHLGGSIPGWAIADWVGDHSWLYRDPEDGT